MQNTISWVLGILFLLEACTRMAPEVEPPTDNTDCVPQFPDQKVTYQNYVKNIVALHCTRTCHKGGNSLGTGNFTTYAGLKHFATDRFYFRVIQNNADMPQGKAPLPKSIRDSLNVWLKNCAPEN
ncbi:hypothetical protein [Solitalea lacus]|uniref:hypothetical protein n=1 Tax=Solitalea lacus TaxID=2911172 RepID=UPI001EDAAFAE|nr:hypothetical protein [Solitalea lacus]UKJ07609.1 hypothetical protein L2B55_00245 [Solitalea lacus]